ncbi:MAG: hypothetical protein HY717_14025 [Planctomycetes bacterium]|nr:hypothetical protein [Planctomycetota bacterium]
MSSVFIDFQHGGQPIKLTPQVPITLLKIEVDFVIPAQGGGTARLVYPAQGLIYVPPGFGPRPIPPHVSLGNRTQAIVLLAKEIHLTTPSGGLQAPGDANQDGGVDQSDAVWLLEHLFLGTRPNLPCEGKTAATPGEGELALLDFNGSGAIDISDAVALLTWRFIGGEGHPLGSACARILGCPEGPCQ